MLRAVVAVRAEHVDNNCEHSSVLCRRSSVHTAATPAQPSRAVIHRAPSSSMASSSCKFPYNGVSVSSTVHHHQQEARHARYSRTDSRVPCGLPTWQCRLSLQVMIDDNGYLTRQIMTIDHHKNIHVLGKVTNMTAIHVGARRCAVATAFPQPERHQWRTADEYARKATPSS